MFHRDGCAVPQPDVRSSLFEQRRMVPGILPAIPGVYDHPCVAQDETRARRPFCLVSRSRGFEMWKHDSPWQGRPDRKWAASDEEELSKNRIHPMAGHYDRDVRCLKPIGGPGSEAAVGL